MRNLTIKRRKRMAGCLVKDTVYIEDPRSEENVLGIPCRALGVLKNGEEKSFEIEDARARVLVVTNKINKEHTSDILVLPRDEKDIVLCGQHYYDGVAGNVFRFDQTLFLESEQECEREYKKRKESSFLSMAIVLLVGVLIGLLLDRIW